MNVLMLPVWLRNCESNDWSLARPPDGPPQLLLTTIAPAAAAAFCAMNRPLPWSSCASMKRSLQVGHTALAMSRSRAASTVQSSPRGELAGTGVAAPVWFTTFKQPLAFVHAGRPNCERYDARSV